MFRKTVDSWDLFDTLVGRFHILPDSIFELMAPKTGLQGFKNARLQAQRDLDAIGKPYDLREIYRQFCRTTGADARTTAPALFALEVATELDQLIPVQAQISQVARGDLIVSDMYMPEDIITDILQRICGLRHNRFPPVVGNWGKSTGTVWPLILQHYIVRRHHGDNRHADIALPQRFHIHTQHVTDTGVTPWENTLLQANLKDVALALREVRLRCTPARAVAFEHAVTGELLGLLLLYALFLRLHAQEHDIRHYLFAAREGVHLSAVFRALMPGFDSETIDFNRRLLTSGQADSGFRSRITPHSAVVDVVSTGRSVGQFCARADIAVPLVTLFTTHKTLLSAQEIEARERYGFHAIMEASTTAQRFDAIEALMDPGYPSVHGIAIDAGSRAVVRVMTPDDQTAQERECARFVGDTVAELVEVIHRRSLRFDGISKEQIKPLLQQAADTLLHLQHHIHSPSYLAKNSFPQRAYDAGQKTTA
ncbi:hypothetical protein [Burkholderia sp. Ax-1719]|uniref:hypothetical protein n=1 Tax=Burkholderia sp. Ax-1719 TaxID=2608334 RepID=UPI0014219A6B|nr:hypothetical protein [Burkholderia sp. Ax-1719]NIE67086.1 hypothetical protein [Burkholderia sp. Ax-1719]